MENLHNLARHMQNTYTVWYSLCGTPKSAVCTRACVCVCVFVVKEVWPENKIMFHAVHIRFPCWKMKNMEIGNKCKFILKSMRPYFTVIRLALKDNLSYLCIIENLHWTLFIFNKMMQILQSRRCRSVHICIPRLLRCLIKQNQRVWLPHQSEFLSKLQRF